MRKYASWSGKEETEAELLVDRLTEREGPWIFF
jgi:hypothetical protein